MAFQWLQMRIGDEQERRRKEAAVLARLPAAFGELHRVLAECIAAYDAAFGPQDAVEIALEAEKIHIAAGARIGICMVPSLPGFQVERVGEEPMLIEVGLLPGDKLFYRHLNQYLTEEELTRRILDRVLFPKLGD